MTESSVPGQRDSGQPASGQPASGLFASGLPFPDRAEFADAVARAVVVRLPMRVRFRGITERELMLFEGPAGWGEFAPFVEYDDTEAASWLRAGIETAWAPPIPVVRQRIEVNATIPAVPAAQVPKILERFPGARTAKVKVAEPGQELAEDLARVAAVRAAGLAVRVDANQNWDLDVAEGALRRLAADGPLDYAEQPVAGLVNLARLRERLEGIVQIAADESIRRSEDPAAVIAANAADVAILKVAPLGGPRRVLDLAARLEAAGIRVVISSALDSAVGIAAGVRTAAALAQAPGSCGLGTTEFFAADVSAAASFSGWAEPATAVPDRVRLAELASSPERARWWRERALRAHALLERECTNCYNVD